MVNASIDVIIRGIWTSPGHDFKGRHGLGRCDHGVVAQSAIECVAGRGIVGDRFFDHREDFKGQITFFDHAVAAQLERELDLPGIDHSAFRRNVMVSGVDLNGLVGRRFRIGEVVFEGSEECAPCYWMDQAIGPGAFEWLKGRGGLRARIRTSGWLTMEKVDFEMIHD